MTLDFKDMHATALYRHFRRQALDHGWTLVSAPAQLASDGQGAGGQWSIQAVRGTEHLLIHGGAVSPQALKVRIVLDQTPTEDVALAAVS